MYLIDIIPLTKIPHPQAQILSYFHGAPLERGALVQIPLGRRQEEGIVIGHRDVANYRMEIKNANFELRNIAKIISLEPILTKQQIELALFLGQYYFCSPGIFAKMMFTRRSLGGGGLSKKSKPAIKSKLKTKSKQTLIIAPTISTAENIAKNYKDATLWHSELTQKQKTVAWLAVKTGQAQTVIGTRSTVFLPFNNLRVITILDPTSPNHRSWDMFPHYDSRVIAQKMAELYKAKVTLKNPLLAIDHLHLAIIDMRQELKNGNFSIFSIALYDAVKKALAEKKQVILFVNRRGAANFILCRDCGYIAKCQNCDAPLAYHTINNKPSLLCHHCGAKDAPPGLCPKCQSWRIKTVGSGSQKIETETKKFFPDGKLLRLDSDNVHQPKDQQKIISAFLEHQADILIATPMIFSWIKELTATKPTVIGILSADTLLHIPDFRSGERTWQTINALASLNYQARFFLQTYNPDNSVLKYVKNNDYAGFAKEDLETRAALNYPPFSQIVKLTFRHRDPKHAGQEAKILTAKLQRINKNDRIEISDAQPAFLPRERGKYVWNIIIKFKIGNLKLEINNEFLLQRNPLLEYIPTNWEIDVDPENLL